VHAANFSGQLRKRSWGGDHHYRSIATLGQGLDKQTGCPILNVALFATLANTGPEWPSTACPFQEQPSSRQWKLKRVRLSSLS